MKPFDKAHIVSASAIRTTHPTWTRWPFSRNLPCTTTKKFYILMLNVRSVHDEDKVLRFVRFKHVGDEYPHLDYYEFDVVFSVW